MTSSEHLVHAGEYALAQALVIPSYPTMSGVVSPFPDEAADAKRLLTAFCHPVSTRARLPPGSDVQGHRLKPCTGLPQPSEQLSRVSEVVYCWSFCPGYPGRAQTPQTTSPNLAVLCLGLNTTSEHRLQAAPGLKWEAML